MTEPIRFDGWWGEEDRAGRWAGVNEVEQRLREIEGRVNKATPGPWRACTWDPMEPPHVTLPLPAGAVCHKQYDLPRTREDAEFIAHAREDVPWLLSLLREREEENRRLRQALMGAAYWYRRSGWTGQAIGELACGHGGPVGAPMCKKCADKAIDAALRGEQP